MLQLFCILGEQARKAWANLRDTFRRKLKTDTETKSGQGRSEIVKWPFFNTMMFLKDVMIPRESSGNLPLTYDENELSPSYLSNATLEDVDEENTNDTEADINCSIREPEESGSEFTSFAKPQSKQQPSSSLKRNNKNDKDTILSKKQKQNSYDSQVLEIERRKINLMEKRFSRPNTHQDDQDYAFFMSLLPSVKQLNQIEKMKLRMKIMNDVTDALEAHQFVKEVNSSRIIPSPIDSPLSSPYSTEGSEHSQSSSMSFQANQAYQTEVQPSQQDLYNLMNL
ncbi:unnamed protein product [Macrosiphum euphorbiae]|uniref:BESS domain-containing protein n=1 Tax=Macrosiphum euphorbiae TaxID=13131 RepID=A0AAV0W7X1_9HEMI|nr:unnamed protein product [Macrosiphum euphorbiae]